MWLSDLNELWMWHSKYKLAGSLIYVNIYIYIQKLNLGSKTAILSPLIQYYVVTKQTFFVEEKNWKM